MKKTMTKSVCVWIAVLLAVLAAAMLTFAYADGAAERNTANRYTLAFSDAFDGTVREEWAYIRGGSSYSFTADEQTVRGWRFGGENHIAYKTNVSTDYGKFLYGAADSTDYVFEVKLKADVDETLGEYLNRYQDNLAGHLTLNTHLPFFVTDPTPDTNAHEFRGRSVCISNYAIGFYEKGVDSTGKQNAGWATNNGTGTASARIRSKFSDSFDWREWHTVRVEATASDCRLWLDGVLMVDVGQSSFARTPATNGYCGFTGICAAAYAPLHFDDFRYYQNNPDYDDTVLVDKTVTSLDASEFLEAGKTYAASNNFAANMTKVEGRNKVAFSYTNVCIGSELRTLATYAYSDFEIVTAFDMENQIADKEAAGFDTSKNIRTADMSGLLFGMTDGATFNGYIFGYMAASKLANGTDANYTEFALYDVEAKACKNRVALGKINGTTSCTVKLQVDSATKKLTYTVYTTQEAYESGNAATLTGTTASKNEDNSYSIDLPKYKTGNIGLRCHAGNTTTQLTYQAEFLAFTGKTQVKPDTVEPMDEQAEQTVTVSASINGTIKANGVAVNAATTVPTHSDVALTFEPDEGYIVDNVTVNGISLGAIGSFVLQNVTRAYTVSATFTDVKTVDVYLLAGQSNAAGFTPVAGLYKGYTYGGEVDREKLAEYENGYTDVLYYGVTQSNAPESLHTKLSFVTAGKGHSGSHMGPELGFAEQIHTQYGGNKGKAAIIKYAVGATSLTNIPNTTQTAFGNWAPPSITQGAEETDNEQGWLYRNLLTTVRGGLQALTDAGYTPIIKGAMWMQGEAESTHSNGTLYEEYISALIADLRKDLTDIMVDFTAAGGTAQDCGDMPFVIGRLGDGLADRDGVRRPYLTEVRTGMQQAAANGRHVRIVYTDDLLVPDGNDNNDIWHFSSKGSLLLGNRFAHVLSMETGLADEETHTVTFDSDGGSTVGAQTVKHWLTPTQPENPQKEGYTFDGWFAADAETPWNFALNAIGADVVLTARYTPVSYTVSYELNGGQFAFDPKQTYDITETVVLPVPGRAGFTFDGWFASADCGGAPVTEIAAGSIGNRQFWAKWTENAAYYTVTVAACEHGTVTTDCAGGSAVAGTLVTVTATPEAGYKLVSISVNDTVITGNTFALNGDSRILAVFARDEARYTVTVAATVNGTATADCDEGDAGTLVTVTATPDEGYVVREIAVNGTAIDGNTFTLTENATVTVTFTPYVARYTVTVTQSEGGTVAVDRTSADENSVITVTVTPDSGFVLDEIRVNGKPIDGNTFLLVEDATVTATFVAAPPSSGCAGCNGSVVGGCTYIGLVLLAAALAAVAVRRKA